MSNYWKRKLKELNVDNSASSGNYWENKQAELKEEEQKTDDIAPVRFGSTGGRSFSGTRTEGTFGGEKERIWFEKGAFEDGYQLWDVSKTILGSATDLAENIGAGVVGIGEKVVDAVAWAAPYVAQGQYYQNGGVYQPLEQQKMFNETIDASKRGAEKFIEKDLYDEEKVAKTIISAPVKAVTGVDAETDSVFGEKSDSLAQSAGQLGATVALQAAGVPWFLTTGVTSFGGEVENSLNQGATMEEAGLSAAITAGAEILTEKISGGISFGGKTLDDVLTKRIARSVSDKTIRTLMKLGLDATGEGFEEVLSGVLSAVGQKLTYADEKELSELFSSEEAWDSFIGGFALGGGSNGINTVKSNKQGVDAVTGLTKNEQAVVDKVYEDRIAEEGESGKVTEKRKAEIYDEVLSDMEKGRITTDTIEEVLGGDSYKAYQDTIKSEEEALNELAELYEGEELQQQINDFLSHSQRDGMQAKLSESVFETVKGDRLAESYFDRARRGETFKADLTKYDAKVQPMIQKAIDSGVLNNTNRTHEFVDMIAKIATDKGVSFDFTSNEKLKDSIFAVDGKTVNGFVTEDGVTLNVNSAKALNKVVGHEITHVLEGTELYTELQNVLFEYAKGRKAGDSKFDSEYKERLYNARSLYKDVEGYQGVDGFNKIKNEVAADLVGDYLFSDTDFIKKLSVEHRNVFQKMFDEVKYLCKVATAGSKEARELAKLQKAFEDAYRAEKNTAISGINYSVSYEDAIDKLSSGTLDRAKNTHLLVAEHTPQVFIDKAGAKDLKIITGWDTAYLAMNQDGELQGNYHGLGADVMKAIPKALEDPLYIVKQKDGRINAVTEVVVKGNRPVLVSVELDAYKATTQDGENKAENYNLIVTFFDAKSNYLQNKVFQGEIKYNKNNEDPAHFILRLKSLKKAVPNDDLAESSFGGRVPQNGSPVKRDYSLSDSDGKQLTKEQQDYFKDSKMRDENGNLKVMYHGTPNGDFTVFKDGTYFTDNKEYADRYQSPSASSISSGKVAANPKTFEVYLDIKKPFDISDAEAREIYINEYIKGGNALGINPYLSDAEYDQIKAIDWTEGEDLRDFLIENGYDYDGLVLDEGADGGYGDDVVSRGKSYVVFSPEQVKSVENTKPTSDPDIRYSLSRSGEQYAPTSRKDVFGKDIALETAPVKEVAPVQKSAPATVAENATVPDVAPVAKHEESMLPDDLAPLPEDGTERIDSLTDADAPPEVDAPYYEDSEVAPDNPMEGRYIEDVGDRSVKAYMYENPEVKPFFQAEANVMLGELHNSIKGERWYNDQVYYESGGEYGWGGVKRDVSDDIAYLLDGSWNGNGKGYTYKQIEDGLKAIIEDHGAENNAVSKRIEFILNDRLMQGHTNFPLDGMDTPPNQDYLRLLEEKQITEYSKEAFDAFMANADDYAPPVEEDIAPVPTQAAPVAPVVAEMAAPVKEASLSIKPKAQKEPRMARATPQEQARAQILTEEPKVDKSKPTAWNLFKDNFVDKGTVFETLSLKTGNRELQAKWKSIGRAESSAQWFMEHGSADTSSLKSIRDTVEWSGKTQQFSEYLYHKHNVDRMSLVARNMDEVDKPVFGYGVTSEMSKAEAAKLEAANPEFKAWAEKVYAYNRSVRQAMVDGGLISQETADWWEKKYPHYVPVRRKGDEGLNINVALDTKRTGVNAPIKKATGGNRDILPLFDTMAMRTEQTYRAVARNRFGVELKNLLGTTVEHGTLSVDEAIDIVENEELLQAGKDGNNPTFTVFENGEKVTFEIDEAMYDTMKPKSKGLAYTNKFLNTANNIRRGLLTEYNPAFMLTNPIKDTQDVILNSQHPAKTYLNYPAAIAELIGKNGQYYREYMEHGGEMNTYFDGETKTFAKEKSGLAKVLGFPLDKISQANNFIERIPRMAEYIASRKEGRSIDVSMLDAARVTTDFSAGGDVVKAFNRNGFTFLNASVQGAAQQVRNVREAWHNGVPGVLSLAAKVTVAGLPAILLNHLLWDDDEEYAELSDYVKQNYYIIGKYGDGKFVRVPKGRALAVIQNAFEQMENLVTGNDDVDLDAFKDLVLSNLAPNNPLENNIAAPVMQAWKNKAWYGDALVPTRLQDLPAAEQYDETTDSISKWLGEKLNISPYKINYVLDQYSGGVGDMILPMLTPEAERGNDSLAGNLLAPIADKFTTDSVLKNQNVSDFYDTKDELSMNAKTSGATDEDVLMSKYMNSINAELSDLYKRKREMQNSTYADDVKYNAVRDIQKQIVDLTRESLNTYEDVSISGGYATIGDRHYRKNDDGEWTKLTDKQLEKQEEVTRGLDISPSEYWGNKEEYDYAYEYPEKYAVAKSVGGYKAYRQYSSELYDIKADKDKDGKSITGSRKEKVLDWINALDADYGTKIILFKSEYNADDTYNYDIIEYLNSRNDISYEETEAILKELGFTVHSDGTVTW